jgi:hypothetical protein
MNLCLFHLAGKGRVGFAVPPAGFKHHLRISAFEYSWEENMEISEREDTQCNWNEFVYPLHIFSSRLYEIHLTYVGWSVEMT